MIEFLQVRMEELTSNLVEDSEYTGPGGARSAGEVPTDGMAPADVKAIRRRDLPVTAEKILRALDELSQQRATP